jgi:hypothetical protein
VSRLRIGGSCTSAPPIDLFGVDRDNFTFTVSFTVVICSRQGMATGRLTSEWPVMVIHLSKKTFTLVHTGWCVMASVRMPPECFYWDLSIPSNGGNDHFSRLYVYLCDLS